MHVHVHLFVGLDVPVVDHSLVFSHQNSISLTLLLITHLISNLLSVVLHSNGTSLSGLLISTVSFINLILEFLSKGFVVLAIYQLFVFLLEHLRLKGIQIISSSIGLSLLLSLITLPECCFSFLDCFDISGFILSHKSL